MARGINRIVLVGRLTKDAELKSTKNGAQYLVFTLAVDRGKDEADFFDVQYWSKNATAVHEWLEKGRQVAVVGCLRQDRWESNGQKYSKIYVLADDVQFLGGSEKVKQKAEPKPTTSDGLNGPENWDDDDDIPF